MQIEIKTNSQSLRDEFSVDVLDGVSLRVETKEISRAPSGNDLILIALNALSSIPAAVLANWISNKIAGKKCQLFVDGKPAGTESSALARAIDEARKE